MGGGGMATSWQPATWRDLLVGRCYAGPPLDRASTGRHRSRRNRSPFNPKFAVFVWSQSAGAFAVAARTDLSLSAAALFICDHLGRFAQPDEAHMLDRKSVV